MDGVIEPPSLECKGAVAHHVARLRPFRDTGGHIAVGEHGRLV